jgi:hypothetical protein
MEAPGIDAVKGAAVLINRKAAFPEALCPLSPLGAREKNGLNAKVRTAVKGVFRRKAE